MGCYHKRHGVAMDFPRWFMSALIAAGGVWVATQYNTSAGWWMAALIVLSVLILRDRGELLRFIGKVTGQSIPSEPGQNVTPVSPVSNW